MSLNTPEIIHKSYPVIIEGIFIFGIALLIVANTTLTDITFHDNYVLPSIETCFPENQEPYCVKIRERMGLATDAQLEIGNIYWDELLRQALFIGVILFLIRLGIGYMLHIQGVRKIRLSTYLMALFWGLVGSSLFLFGFLDTLYFVFQAEEPDDELAWLNNAGIFTETKSFTGDPNVVEKEDLYLTNILGLIIIFSFLSVIIYLFSRNGQKNRGIA